jgi:hypothetical protein
MTDPELQQRFRELLKRCDESHLEYEEKHGDAGDAYTHCVVEDSHRVKAVLEEYIQTNFPDWTPDETRMVVDEFDAWSFDMEPGHRFSGRRNSDVDEAKAGCQVWSSSIEEVENQVEVKMLAEELDCEVEDIRELVLAERENPRSDFCIGSIYRPETFNTFETYQCTDACWFAVVPYAWFEDSIEDIRDRVEDMEG